ncbi:hypothetical protein [Polyangium mundeleinium]|uniref:Tetratricopeptide repeat protein n=1 Tax=Polyangium mundeleinium TaxID=2995306 RepID=A0ABT5EQS8_9BACT|nr:hypothetical protein [Polyangium mundeleinium]MDC0743538.1 hypothetical protein [Polyangium mundeleinium]
MRALEKGDLARAETELAELKRLASGGNDELVYAIAAARKEDIVIPDAPEARGNLPRFRRMHLQAHAVEIRGKLAEAERAYERLFDEREKCGKRVFDRHLLCGPYIADGLVRRAELQHKRGENAEALTTLDAGGCVLASGRRGPCADEARGRAAQKAPCGQVSAAAPHQ